MVARLTWVLAAAAIAAAAQESRPAGDGLRPKLEAALRKYFAAEKPDGPPLREVLALAKGHEDLLATIVRDKTFVTPSGPVRRHGTIDARYRFRDAGDAASRPAGHNDALFFGPEATGASTSLVVFVPDTTETSGYEARVTRDGPDQGRFVHLVPDEKQDNKWNPSLHEEQRHVGPLRGHVAARARDRRHGPSLLGLSGFHVSLSRRGGLPSQV